MIRRNHRISEALLVSPTGSYKAATKPTHKIMGYRGLTEDEDFEDEDAERVQGVAAKLARPVQLVKAIIDYVKENFDGDERSIYLEALAGMLSDAAAQFEY